uniref:Protein kinase domain-containing protein n=1 Tax=Oryza punctata TaxID=4537 RepID=A0A0E0KW52_ORYPU
MATIVTMPAVINPTARCSSKGQVVTNCKYSADRAARDCRGDTGIIIGGIAAILVLKFIMRCVEAKHAERARRQEEAVSPPASGTYSSVATGAAPRHRHHDVRVEMGSVDRFLDDILREKPARFTPENLREFTGGYAERLGAGGFGVVYRGRFPNGVQVAVKVLHRTLDRRAEEQFMAEVATAGRTYHINLVRLYGFCFDATTKALVYEYLENGSLDRVLFDRGGGGAAAALVFDTLHGIVVGTARGVRYLHEECQHRIIHYDIKPGNVLLTSDYAPKVADFGLAKLCNRDNTHLTMTGARGTPGYAAPELWLPLPLTHKCDVYSFGMLVFEILGRRRNLDTQRPTESQEWYPKWAWQRFDQGRFDEVMAASGIRSKDGEKAERMCKVALWCIQYQPGARPSMSSVVRMLEGEEQIARPVNPFAYMASLHAISTSSSGGVSTATSVSGDSCNHTSIIL